MYSPGEVPVRFGAQLGAIIAKSRSALSCTCAPHLLPLHPISLRMNTYLINLDRAPLRRFRMERLLAGFGLAFERVAAVDGAGLSLPHPSGGSNVASAGVPW